MLVEIPLSSESNTRGFMIIYVNASHLNQMEDLDECIVLDL